jgi:EpsI family protein
MRFPVSRHASVLSLVLLLEAGAFYAVANRAETAPPALPLSLFPAAFEQWRLVADQPIEPEVEQVLKADDTMNRIYGDPAGNQIAMFVAFFKTQRSGQMPHSPKNCLPGSGWEPIENGTAAIAVSGAAAPIVVNRYVVQRGDQKSLTLYWYQSRNKVIASEVADRIWLIEDAIRYRRSDTALVRISVPISANDVAAADATGVRFVQAVFPLLLRQLPS